MRRVPGVEMKPEQKVGPDEQRFGAWARTLARGAEAKFELDPGFARSLSGTKAALRAIFFDRGAGRIMVQAGGRKFERALADSGRWQTAEVAIDRAGFTDIAVSATADLTLHMIEVARTE
jgi:hypothetical protein